MTEDEAKKQAEIAYEKHHGEWLTREIVYQYQERARKLENVNMQMVGERRELMLELKEKYDITEIEAINIINGFHTEEVINRYDRMEKKLSIDTSVRKNHKMIKQEENDDSYKYEGD